MSEKSYVSLAQHICPCCTVKHDTGEILLDRRLKSSMESKTVTGWGYCPECQNHITDGMVALVIIDPDKSTTPFQPDSVYRTGDILWIKKEIFTAMFDIQGEVSELSFGDMELFNLLKAKMNENSNQVH